MRRSILIALAATAALASPAAAQTWGRYDGSYSYDSGRGYESGYRQDRDYGQRGDWNAVPSNFDWRGQVDRPGDYRCDPFWDADRSDCGAGWRDQRDRVSPQARRDYRQLAGYRSGDGYGYRQDHRSYSNHGYGSRRRGYGAAYGYGSGHQQSGTAYAGAYGRPDIVYPGGGRSYTGHDAGGRDQRRVDWCRYTYRSYDPASGYYRAYSGRLIFCG